MPTRSLLAFAVAAAIVAPSLALAETAADGDADPAGEQGAAVGIGCAWAF